MVSEIELTQSQKDDLVISLRGWLDSISPYPRDMRFDDAVIHSEEINALCTERGVFCTKYGLEANSVFVGPSHWLATNKIAMIYGMKVIVVGPTDIEIGLRWE